jgi:hypothetical protein
MRSPSPPAVASRLRSSGSPSPSPPRRKKAQKPKKSPGAIEEDHRTRMSRRMARKQNLSEPSETGTVATRTRSHSFDEADQISTIQKYVHKNRNHLNLTGDGKKISDGGEKLSRVSRKMARKQKRKQKKKHRN